MGYWTRSNAEPCLLFTKGSPKRVDKGVKQIVVDEAAYPLALVSPVTKHSRKPPQVYDGIERLMGDVPRLELFARNERLGWDCIGNEIDGRDIREVFEEMAA